MTRHRADPDRAQRRAERREALLDAALAAIRREGAQVSMEQIGAEAGVTKPILYRHFGDRDGLVAALAERFGAGLLTDLRASLESGLEPRDLLRATIDAYVAFIERDPEVYRFLVRQASPRTTLVGIMPQVGQEVAVVVGERLRAAGLDSGAAEPWGYGMVGMVHLAGDWWVERRTMPRARLVEYLVNLLWDGLRSYDPGLAETAAPDG